MSTLQVSTAQITTLSDGSNATSCTNAIQGSAKAWVNFNGTTSPGTIRASYNVSSVTKNGTGDYTVNFTTALADANYSLAGTCNGTSGWVGGNSQFVVELYTAASPTSSAFRVYTKTTGGVGDVANVNVAIFR